LRHRIFQTRTRLANADTILTAGSSGHPGSRK
jgi:hypothetical protein